ncbi:MAG: class I SAM-dependent methyltransferase [Gemmataceae bacterium]|nr:class I SAM-dependent methyltransferase [Gemmataceae bacterium]
MLGVTNTKYALRQHLSQIGFLVDQPPQVVERELARHMGPERYARFQQIRAAALRDGEEGQNRAYDFMQDLREANLLRCLSPDVTLDTSYHLYEKALPLLTPGKRLIELACWTGGLSSFVAHNHPDCTVVGVDRARHIVELNRVHYRLPNLGFVPWDYRTDKPGGLEPADVLLCGLGTNNDCPPGTYSPRDPLTVRDSAGYRREKEEGSRYFAHWRQAARDGAVLLTVLRVFTFARFLAFIDAAQEAGWSPLFEHLQLVQCPGNKESIPSLRLAARPSQPVSEDVALSHWASTWMRNQHVAFSGDPGLAMYRALGHKQVLAEREGRTNLGYAARQELGICGAIGYLFSQDARPGYELVLMSVAQAEARRQEFARPPQQQTPGAFTVYSQ